MFVPHQGRSILREAADVEYLHTKEGIASLRDLIRRVMRMSPDRIVIGKVRGAEALDLLEAWNVGHSGGGSTIRANSAQKVLVPGLVPGARLLRTEADIPNKASHFV